MVSLAALGAAFAVVALSELGDKTQLVVVSLSARYSRRAVFLGAVLAEVAMAAVAVSVGIVILLYVPVVWVQRASAVSFLLIGVYLLWKREEEPEEAPVMDERRVFLSTFGLVAFGEVGDKTQLAIIALAAATQAPGEVFVGACLALAAMMGLAVVIGDRLAHYLKERTMRTVGAALFLVAGALLLAESLWP